LVVFFPAPASYTGEDSVEFTCHGGVLASAQLLAALGAAGARPARAGEFTRRAVQNGKIDLLQAEAIGDLVDATTRAQGRAALRQLEGGLSRKLEEVRRGLVDSLALLSYDIDFPEEDDGPIDRSTIRASIEQCHGAIEALLRTAALGERVRSGALVVLAGRPNAGKSSLFNALLGSERALVTEIPGTTRDTIEADLDVDGWPVRIADTAGLRTPEDRIERMGIEVSRRYLGAADLILRGVGAAPDPTDEERDLARQPRALLVRTKADRVGGAGDLGVSARTGAGLDALKHALIDRLFSAVDQVGDVEPLVTRERHRRALEEARSALVEALPEAEAAGDAVLAAHHVRRGITALDELIGLVDVEEVIGRIFEKFCVGK
jgi:tRNA modification GTPase